MNRAKFKRLAKKSLKLEEVQKRTWVEQAKEEARQNLQGEDLEKCLKALEAWERNSEHE